MRKHKLLPLVTQEMKLSHVIQQMCRDLDGFLMNIKQLTTLHGPGPSFVRQTVGIGIGAEYITLQSQSRNTDTI